MQVKNDRKEDEYPDVQTGQVTLCYRVSGWTQSRLAELPLPSIRKENSICSLDMYEDEVTDGWKEQDSAMAAILEHAGQYWDEGSLAPELSLVYVDQRAVRAMLLVTGADGELCVREWYVQDPQAYRELCYLLQLLFSAAEDPIIPENRISFVCSSPKQEQMVEYLLEGAEPVEELPDPQMMFPEFFMAVTRLQALVQPLAEKGYASILMYPPGGLPYLQILRSESEPVLEVSYRGVWEEEEQTGFLLSIMPAGTAELPETEDVYEVYEEPLEMDTDLTLGRILGAM